MTPEETLKLTESYLQELEEATKRVLKVGLPSDKVGSEIYGDGQSVMSIGAMHEYGTEKMPARSFLRMPFDLKRDVINKTINNQFKAVLEGKRSAVDGLEIVGIQATNISKEAFRTNGFGQWAPLAPGTVTAKQNAGKQTPLIWSGILRNSVTWSVE